MQLKVNKEIREYSETIFFGLTMRQFVFSLLACIVALIIYFLVIDQLGMELTSWLCVLGAFPFASLGFITFQQMNAESILFTAWHSFLLSHSKLIDRPYNLYKEAYDLYLKEKKKEEKYGIKKSKKLFKKK